MGSETYKKIENFISDSQVEQIIAWTKSLNYSYKKPNHHLNEISKALNGNSFIFDISNNEITNYITEYQSIGQIFYNKPPQFILNLQKKIANLFQFDLDNSFLQVVNMNKGGEVSPHYDASVDGFINYKCNLSVLSEDYYFFVDTDKFLVKNKDLYCFEASLFKHKTERFNSERIMLSFGFMIPYHKMNRSESDPRVRLSKRIKKYFQN